MSELNDTLIINVTYSTEDEDYGAVYIATNDQIGLVTDGRTFEELQANIREAIDACLGDVDTITAYHLIPNPKIELRIQLTHAEIA